MQAIIFALIAHLAWGTNVFGTLTTRKIGAYKTAFWLLLLLVPIYAFFCLLYPVEIQNLTLSVFLLNVFLGIIGSLSMILYYESLRLGNPSLVNTISASYPALVVALSIIFLKESISNLQIAAIFIITLGVILSSFNAKDLKGGKFKISTGVLLAILTMLSWSIYYTFIKIPISQIGPAWPNLLAAIGYPVLLLAMKVRSVKTDFGDFKKAKYPIIFNAAFLGTGLIAFNYAVSQGGSVAVVTPISASYPALFAVISFFVFKQQLKINEILGIITTLTGIVLLAFFSI